MRRWGPEKTVIGRPMSFTLYNAPQSTCSQRVRFVLNAKKISFAEIKLDLLAGDQLKPDYLALNPNGVVPTLDHDGAIVIDSSVIIEYLDEVVGPTVTAPKARMASGANATNPAAFRPMGDALPGLRDRRRSPYPSYAAALADQAQIRYHSSTIRDHIEAPTRGREHVITNSKNRFH